MTTTDTRPDIPLGYTYDTNGKLLTYKNHSGYWCEHTYDTNGKVLTHKDSNGDRYEYTYDTNGNALTYKDNDYWWERTYDTNDKVLTHKNSHGVEWTAVAHADNYTLGYDTCTHEYHAGCRVFTRAEALAHWGTPRADNATRAAIFVTAINNHKE